MEETNKCKIGLKKGLITEEVFKRELNICRDLRGVCGWGECESCGVIPLLIKLHDGILLEGKDVIKTKREDSLKG